MKSTRSLWTSIALASIIATAVCLGGFVYAVNDIMNPQPGNLGEGPVIPQQEQDQLAKLDRIQIAALGDSLTKGTGDQTGKGYVGNVKELLEKQSGKPVNIIGNYAVNGYTTSQLLNDLKTKNAIADTLRQADIILFTIGGNDLFAIGRELLNTTTDQLDPDKVKSRMPEPMKRFDEIAAQLNQINPKAIKIYTGVHNPFYDTEINFGGDRQLSQHVQEWNAEAFSELNKYPNMIFVSTFDLFQLHFSKYIYSDHFHPNQEGYERIAQRIVQSLE